MIFNRALESKVDFIDQVVRVEGDRTTELFAVPTDHRDCGAAAQPERRVPVERVVGEERELPEQLRADIKQRVARWMLTWIPTPQRQIGLRVSLKQM